MNVEEKYTELYQTLLKEHKEVFEKQDVEELSKFMDLICKADRIFLMGVGREGISTRGFAMRLMHLGKETHWIWDDTTPGMHPGDLFIATNGSGAIGHITYVVEQAKKAGATVAVVTGSPKQTCPQLADLPYLYRRRYLTERMTEQYHPSSRWEICLNSICICFLI